MCVTRVRSRGPCMCEWPRELLGCIGILKCDWQGRSLLGEIVNRVEPVICSRQPWKGGTADSQGSYWEFQRCCLTDLGPGPRRTEPASRACFSNPRLINALSHSPSFRSVCFSAALLFFFFLSLPLSLPSLISSSILSLFLFPTLLTLHFPQPVIQIVSSPLYSIFQYARNFAYTEHNLIRTIRHIETTNQAILLHRQAQKQIKLADVLTLYFPSLF